MALVVVGGHTRNIGKTTLAAQIIGATRERHWTAMKITQYGHNVCSANGEACDCADADHPVAISEERSASSGTDTARMLAAGAQRVLWVRTQQGSLLEAMPRIRKEIAATGNLLIESNSILRFLRPDLYVAVLNPAVADFKPSALRYLDRADALFVPEQEALADLVWTDVPATVMCDKPIFELCPDALKPQAEAWVKTKLQAAAPCAQPVSSAMPIR